MPLFIGKRVLLSALVCLVLIISGCGGRPSAPSDPPTPPPPAPSPSPPSSPFGHVFLVVEENHSYSEVIGNVSMSYFNSLASSYGLATQYYANTHPSIGNYLMLVTGQIITNNEATPPPTITDDSIVRELLLADKTWKSYAEALPSIGYTGPDVYPYAQHHNPFVFLSDVLTSSQVNNLVPFSQFAIDLAANQLPNFSYILPDQLDNAHDGTLAQADTWLQQNIAPLISSAVFQKDGLLIIVFDESEFTDLTNGGGHVATLVISPHSKTGYQSVTLYQHPSTLRLILHSLGVTTFPGAAATAPDMSDFF
jgi:phospholipase C